MAEKRMISRKVIESDVFMDMPLSSQALYFHLCLQADDDGFVNNPKMIQRMIGASLDDLNVLIAKNFVLRFDSGVVVVTHWKVHNYIPKDRYKPSCYIEEKKTLELLDNGLYTTCIQNVCEVDTQIRLDKIRLDKNRLDKYNDISPASPPKNVRHKYGRYKNVLLSDADMEKLKAEFPNDYQQRIEILSEYIASTGRKYKNFLATIRAWARKEKGASKHNGEPNTVTTGEFIPTQQSNFHIDRTNLCQD